MALINDDDKAAAQQGTAASALHRLPTVIAPSGAICIFEFSEVILGLMLTLIILHAQTCQFKVLSPSLTNHRLSVLKPNIRFHDLGAAPLLPRAG
jgi:hypothetical protein